MAFVAFDRVLVVDRDDFLLFGGDKDGLSAASDASLGAGFTFRIGAFDATFVVDDPTGHGAFRGPGSDCEQEHEGCYQGEKFSHLPSSLHSGAWPRFTHISDVPK